MLVYGIHFCYLDKRQEIKFPFDLTSDTAESIAAEMVREIGLATSARIKLADAIFDSSNI
jgi:hypothetical protein